VRRSSISIAAALTVSALAIAPTASADPQSYLEALHVQGITSPYGDDALLDAGMAVCKVTAAYLRVGGSELSKFGARRKTAEDLLNENHQRPRAEIVAVTNTAIDELCPQYNFTSPAE